MALANTTDDLLTSVKLACFSPARQTTITDANILLMASEELLGIVAPMVKGAHESYFIARADYTLSSLVDNGFALPSRAMGAAISRVMLLNPDGSLYNCPPVRGGDPETLSNAPIQGYAPVYYVQNHKIFIAPYPPQQQEMYLYYYPRPADLVSYASDTATVATIGGSSFTISQAVPGLSTGVVFDVIDKDSPYAFIAMDQTATVSGTTITMTPPSGMEVGDIVSLAQTSGIPQIPYDLHPVLRYRTSARVMQALGDFNGEQAMSQKAAELYKSAMSLIEPRIDNQMIKIRPRTTPFRSPARWPWFRRW